VDETTINNVFGQSKKLLAIHNLLNLLNLLTKQGVKSL